MNAWPHLACAAAAFTGWLAWALTVERHRADTGRSATALSTPPSARRVAASLLLAACAIAIGHEGWSFGVLSAFAWLSTSGFAVVLLLAWWPQRAASLLRAASGVLAGAVVAWWLAG